MMPRWHHSDTSSERYQEVKSIKTFYAAHISRSQAKSMFGNWTNSYLGNMMCNFPSIEDSTFCKVLSSGVHPVTFIARDLPYHT